MTTTGAHATRWAWSKSINFPDAVDPENYIQLHPKLFRFSCTNEQINDHDHVTLSVIRATKNVSATLTKLIL